MLKDSRGFTLIELLIASTILLLVLAVAYMMYDFGNRSFVLGEKRSIEQSNVRHAADFIVGEVRNSREMTLVSKPVSYEAGYRYIYVDGSVLRYVVDGVVIDKTEAFIVELTPMFTMELIDGENYLRYTIRGVYGYEVKTGVALTNVRGQSPEQGQAVKYK